MLPQNKTLKLGALRLDLRSYLCPSATSLSRVHGGSDAAICHDTRQSSRSISVTIVNLVRVGPNDDPTRTISFVPHFEPVQTEGWRLALAVHMHNS